MLSSSPVGAAGVVVAARPFVVKAPARNCTEATFVSADGGYATVTVSGPGRAVLLNEVPIGVATIGSPATSNKTTFVVSTSLARSSRLTETVPAALAMLIANTSGAVVNARANAPALSPIPPEPGTLNPNGLSAATTAAVPAPPPPTHPITPNSALTASEPLNRAVTVVPPVATAEVELTWEPSASSATKRVAPPVASTTFLSNV